MREDCDVLVVGAGISGLTAAFRLSGAGLRVRVVDAAARAGGVIATERLGDVLCERGPNSMLETPFVNALLSDLGLAAERVEARAAASKRYVVRDGKLVPLPLTLRALVTSPLFSARAKLRLLKEPFFARANADAEESVAQFVARRLGREMLDYAVEPFVAGIYAGDPDELSVRAAFPRLHALEHDHGSLLRGQLRAPREGRTQKAAGSVSFRDGMQALPDALARALGGVRANTRVTRLERGTDGRLSAHGESAGAAYHAAARFVVLAVPAPRAAALVRDFAPDASRALEEIPYAAVASVALAYARSAVTHPLDGFGFLAPRAEKRRVLGTLFSSSMFEGRAPADAVLLTTFLGGRRIPEMAARSEDDLVSIVREELGELVGATGTPRVRCVTRWPEAIPQYSGGHLERVRRAESAEAALPGLFLCGSYRGGVSVGDCIKSAEATAQAVKALAEGIRP